MHCANVLNERSHGCSNTRTSIQNTKAININRNFFFIPIKKKQQRRVCHVQCEFVALYRTRCGFTSISAMHFHMQSQYTATNHLLTWWMEMMECEVEGGRTIPNKWYKRDPEIKWRRIVAFSQTHTHTNTMMHRDRHHFWAGIVSALWLKRANLDQGFERKKDKRTSKNAIAKRLIEEWW